MPKFRLYIDESGDHTYNNIEDINKRFLALLGCIIEYNHYLNEFQPELENLKKEFLIMIQMHL